MSHFIYNSVDDIIAEAIRHNPHLYREFPYQTAFPVPSRRIIRTSPEVNPPAA